MPLPLVFWAQNRVKQWTVLVVNQNEKSVVSAADVRRGRTEEFGENESPAATINTMQFKSANSIPTMYQIVCWRPTGLSLLLPLRSSYFTLTFLGI